MDMVGDLAEEEDGVSALEEALPPGLMLAWEGEDCLDVAISSVVLRGCPPRRVTLMVALGQCLMGEQLIRELCHMVMLDHLLWEQCQE
jgi:hypothetical protein